MKKYIAIALVASVGLSLTSCNDFLDDNRYPKTSIVNSPEYWTNPNNVQLQLDRFVDELTQAYGTGGAGGWFYFRTLNDDQVGSSFADWTYPTIPAKAEGDWKYTVIRGVSYVLDNISPTALSSSDYANFSGIARLVRGYTYYNLVRKYGDVVWVDHVVDPTDSEILYGPRTSRDIVMDYVIEDLQYASQNIQAQSSATTWSKDYALATLSEVALYEGTFCRYRTKADNGLEPDEARAKKYLAISASASEDLLGRYGFTNDYHSIYNSLWTSAESTVVPGAKITGLSENPELIVGRRYDETNGRHSTISYTCSSTTTSGMSLDGFKSFLYLDGKPYGGESLEGENTTFNGQPAYSIQKLLDVRDKRLSIITDPYVYYAGMTWSRNGASGMMTSSGFGIAKYDNVLLPVTARQNSAQNYTSAPMYWTSYIALNYAEAKAELGQFGDAEFAKSLKKLYERAGLTTITGVAAMKAITDPANKEGIDNLLYEIRRCRRCELMFDNWYRYWDLVRWHQLDRLDSKKNPDILRGAYVGNANVKPATVDAEGYVRPYPTNNRIYNAKYYLYPIPTEQRQLNPNLGQNPGWK